MIDTNGFTMQLVAASRQAPDAITAEQVVANLLADLRVELASPLRPGDPVPMIRTWSPHGPSRGESAAETAVRLRTRMDEIVLAKRWGDATDVQRMIALTLAELRQVALDARQARSVAKRE